MMLLAYARSRADGVGQGLRLCRYPWVRACRGCGRQPM